MANTNNDLLMLQQEMETLRKDIPRLTNALFAIRRYVHAAQRVVAAQQYLTTWAEIALCENCTPLDMNKARTGITELNQAKVIEASTFGDLLMGMKMRVVEQNEASFEGPIPLEDSEDSDSFKDSILFEK